MKPGDQISAVCRVCADTFVYTYSGGRPKTVCTAVCKARFSSICKAGPSTRYGPCSVEGCAGLATRIAFGKCESHYIRNRRTGNLVRIRKPRRINKSGYELEPNADHPLASNNGYLYIHRGVAWDKHSGICPPCFWCNKEISWKLCHIDHLNGVKHDNRADNLEVTCAQCNRMRGASWGFISSLSPDRFTLMAKLAGVDL